MTTFVIFSVCLLHCHGEHVDSDGEIVKHTLEKNPLTLTTGHFQSILAVTEMSI